MTKKNKILIIGIAAIAIIIFIVLKKKQKEKKKQVNSIEVEDIEGGKGPAISSVKKPYKDSVDIDVTNTAVISQGNMDQINTTAAPTPVREQQPVNTINVIQK